MKMLFDQIRKNTKLSDNEQQIVTYILENLDEVPKLSSRELAKRCYTTATSVVRLVKKLGYDNYNEFKYNLVSSLKNTPLDNLEINQNDNAFVLLNKMAMLEKEAIDQTKEILDVQMLQEIVLSTKDMTYIDIICSDTNKHIAFYASHYLLTIGKVVSVYDDSDKQFHLCLNVPSNHFVIFITKSGASKQFEKYLKILKQRGIKTMLITGNNNTLLSELCDYTLLTPFNMFDYEVDDAVVQMQNIVFHTSLKYIFDVFYSLIYSVESEESHRKLKVYRDVFM